MPPQQTIQNNFKEGLKTEFTGLNFPEDAATDASNCVFTLIGDTQRRGGINYEANSVKNNINFPNTAKSSFRWLNAGGDGTSQLLVQQIGSTLYFFKSSAATIANPLSATRLPSSISLLPFLPTGSTADPSQLECQYAMGNGYLFVFHPNCDPFYCVFVNNQVTATVITLQIRDVIGIPETGVPDNFRPNTLTQEHLYNLINQGWTQGSGWTGNGTAGGLIACPSVGQIWTIPITAQTNTTSITGGSSIAITGPAAKVGPNNGNVNTTVHITGTVSTYTVGPPSSMTLTVTKVDYDPNTTAFGFWAGGNFTATPNENLSLSLVNQGFINTWFSALKNYPSNSDIWWLYKDTTDAFNPASTFPNVQQLQSPAPKGAFVLNLFNQQRSTISNISGLTDISTSVRPSTGTFFQGRVWYAGINAFNPATGDAPAQAWSENLYFSQIVESPINFGRCYQTNDPTSQTTFSILPTDGGVITIPGSGAVYKLFNLRFGLLVFAANGIWFISGSSGIGFTADDFTVTKISSIQSISGTSFIEVQGYPFFWNQEGIYEVTPTQQAGSAHSPDIQLDVRNICLGTILSYYANIPLISKASARGDYHQIDYIVQWCFRSTNETGIGDRYNYDTILNYNVVTKAFYPYVLPKGNSIINDVKFIQNPGGSGAPAPTFKYITTVGPINTFIPIGVSPQTLTFSEENDFTHYVDFISENGIGYDFTSFFVTGYMLPGQALRKIQIPYIYIFSRNPLGSKCVIQAIWDYASGTANGKESTRQIITMGANSLYRKIRLRGRGMAVQIKISSVSGQPFDLMGWSILDQVNQTV